MSQYRSPRWCKRWSRGPAQGSSGVRFPNVWGFAFWDPEVATKTNDKLAFELVLHTLLRTISKQSIPSNVSAALKGTTGSDVNALLYS